MPRLVIVGAGAAGMAAATRARRVCSELEIVVVESSGEFSRGTCSLPYLLSGEIPNPDYLQGISRETLETRKIELRLNTRARKIVTHQRKLETSGETLLFDKLIVSTGSRPAPNPPIVSSAQQANIWTIRNKADVLFVRRAITEHGLRRVAVIGGGYVGIEFAEAFNHLGLEVTVFHRQPHLMGLHGSVGETVATLLCQRGVQVCRQHNVTQIEVLDTASVLTVDDEDGNSRQMSFQAVCLCPGVEPVTDLLSHAGARLGPHRGVLVNSRGETTLSGIYACGDGVEIPDSRGGRSRWVPLATTAARLGRVCGENAAGGSKRLGQNHGCLSVRIFAQQLGVVGQPRDWNESVPLEFGWGHDAQPFRTRRSGRGVLFVDARNERLRGLQAIGPEAAQLADLVSLAIDQDMTPADIADQDFSYNPPLSGLWHPLYLASRQFAHEHKDNL